MQQHTVSIVFETHTRRATERLWNTPALLGGHWGARQIAPDHRRARAVLVKDVKK